MKTTIGITIGDPAGVGPEIVLKALSQPSVQALARFVVFGDEALLWRVNERVLHHRSLPEAGYVSFNEVDLKKFKFGKATAQNGAASGAYIASAVRHAMLGKVDAIVTAPINKKSFALSGWGKKHRGHTELLAYLTGVSNASLLLAHGPLRAVHVTSHVPLKEVPRLISVKRVLETIILADRGMKELGIRRPRVAVCGLNPHAGDDGVLGSEEKKIISPAVRMAARRGVRVSGPFSADIVWPMVTAGEFDVGVAMYHDQGQIPVKFAGFQKKAGKQIVRGVNVTIGLPIIRTSVAHGTAYELAGKGVASEQSMIDAIKTAVNMVRIKRA